MPAIIIIRVQRNKHIPTISNMPSTVVIKQAAQKGKRVFTVEALDGDESAPYNQLTFQIVGDDNAPAFFAIDKNGVISVRNDLRSAPGSDTQYGVCGTLQSVCVRVCIQGWSSHTVWGEGTAVGLYSQYVLGCVYTIQGWSSHTVWGEGTAVGLYSRYVYTQVGV